MSISTHISAELAQLEGTGRLFRYLPDRRRPVRRLYMCANLRKELTSANSAFAILDQLGAIKDVLERWTTGGRVWKDPQGKPRFLKPVFPPPPNVWEMLITEPRAQVRIFFHFAEPDTIVATNIRTRGLLGRRGSKMWKEAKTESMQLWNDLFSHPPFSGQTIHDYVTGNCDDFAI